MFKNKTTIIFDMDGTLIDSVGVWNDVDRALITRIRTDGKTELTDIQKTRDTMLRAFSHTPNPYVSYCGYLKETYGAVAAPEELYALRHQISQEYLQNVIDYKKDADTLIHALKKAGYTLMIATTTNRNNMEIYRLQNQNIREKANIDDYFTAVYTREDAKNIKPHPEIFLRLMREHDVTPQECLVFEDSLVGVEAAKNAGIETVAVYDKYSDADRSQIHALASRHIDGFTEVLGLLP